VEDSDSTVAWTPQEQAWLQQHPTIRVGLDPAWPPFSSNSNDGHLAGMDVDFLNLLQARLGIKFVLVTGDNWSEVYAKAKRHEVDMLAGVAYTPERAADFNFTRSYVSFPVGIITRNDAPFMIGFANLQGQIVAAPRDYAPTLLLQRDYPSTQLVLTHNVGEALKLVATGRAYATLDNLASASYIIRDRGLSNLKVAGVTDYQFALRYGVRKDWPELTGLLEKALDSVPDHDFAAVKDKWISLDVDALVASSRGQRILYLCLSVIALAVIIVLAWNWAMAREITRRRQAELALEEARNKALDASRMKSDFLANLSHEIRNPLNALLGFTELLKQEASDERQRKYVDAIDAGGRTLLGVINDVLDLSKVEAGRLEIHPAPVSLAAVLRETHSLFTQRAAQKGIVFTQEIEGALPPLLLLDELRLRQVLYNAVSNAIKFTERGCVLLKARYEPGHEEGCLTVEVSDTGPGIPAVDHQRIFEPFAQRQGQDPLMGGTGLGLAISKRLTEWMGGRVELDSVVGRGSTFRFIFSGVKEVPVESVARVEKAGDLADFKPMRVLVVDDLESNRELLKEYFQRAGHVVWDAADAEQGLVVAKTQLPDLVLMDYRLPGMNGAEAARQLRADPATTAIPLMFLSGSLGVALAVADQPGAIVLAKPLNYREFVAALSRLMPDFLKNG
jgi:signal transduction histidine kinase/ActR/RegA family two-component response regulator